MNAKYTLLIFTLYLILTGSVIANVCGSLENTYGPFDYTNPVHFTKMLPVVEKYHFTRDVEMLVSGETSSIIGDIDYTLRAFPNHHKALYALSRYTIMMEGKKKEYRAGGQHFYSAECYFDRAIRFKPDDGYVRYLYALFLHKKRKYKEALTQYDIALKYLPELTELHYNVGLLYFDMGKMDKAQKHAILAYEGGYPLPWLRDELKKKGLWKKQ